VIRREAQLRSEARSEGQREGRSEGQTEGERAAVYDLCEVLNVPLTVRRRKQVEKMGLEELRVLRQHLKKHQSWPQS
jgi:hypothetical protein